jgi:hypothetical protein
MISSASADCEVQVPYEMPPSQGTYPREMLLQSCAGDALPMEIGLYDICVKFSIFKELLSLF